MPASRPSDDLPLEVCIQASRLNVGGLWLESRREEAVAAMKETMQLMVAKGRIISWRGVRIDEHTVYVEYYEAPGNPRYMSLRTGGLRPENVLALEVMCS